MAHPIQEEWFVGWESMGIDMHNLPDDALTWHEIEVLRAFAEHGEKRFWLEPIWDIDWNKIRQSADGNKIVILKQITYPTIFYRFFGFGIDLVMRIINYMPWSKVIWKKYIKTELYLP